VHIRRVQPKRCNVSQFLYFCKTLYTSRTGFFCPSSGARLAAGSTIGLINTWRCMCSFELLMIGRKNRLKHTERLTEMNKLWNVASCWLYSANSVLASACRGEVDRPRVSTGLSTLTKKWPPGTLQVYRADDGRFPFRLPLITTFVVSRDETRTYFTPAASSRFRLEKLIVVFKLSPCSKCNLFLFG